MSSTQNSQFFQFYHIIIGLAVPYGKGNHFAEHLSIAWSSERRERLAAAPVFAIGGDDRAVGAVDADLRLASACFEDAELSQLLHIGVFEMVFLAVDDDIHDVVLEMHFVVVHIVGATSELDVVGLIENLAVFPKDLHKHLILELVDQPFEATVDGGGEKPAEMLCVVTISCNGAAQVFRVTGKLLALVVGVKGVVDIRLGVAVFEDYCHRLVGLTTESVDFAPIQQLPFAVFTAQPRIVVFVNDRFVV